MLPAWPWFVRECILLAISMHGNLYHMRRTSTEICKTNDTMPRTSRLNFVLVWTYLNQKLEK
jgi:hypothetical protein